MPTVTNHMAQELTVLDVAPPPEEIQRRVPQSRWPVASSGSRAGHRWSVRADASRQRAGASSRSHEGSGPGVHCGAVSGATPRVFASISSMAIASSICGVGIRCTTNGNLVRRARR